MSRSIDWHKHVSNQRSSGLSVQGYCQQHGIHPSRLYYWQKKLIKPADVSKDFTRVELATIRCTLEIGSAKIQLDGHADNICPIIVSMLKSAS